MSRANQTMLLHACEAGDFHFITQNVGFVLKTKNSAQLVDNMIYRAFVNSHINIASFLYDLSSSRPLDRLSVNALQNKNQTDLAVFFAQLVKYHASQKTINSILKHFIKRCNVELFELWFTHTQITRRLLYFVLDSLDYNQMHTCNILDVLLSCKKVQISYFKICDVLKLSILSHNISLVESIFQNWQWNKPDCAVTLWEVTLWACITHRKPELCDKAYSLFLSVVPKDYILQDLLLFLSYTARSLAPNHSVEEHDVTLFLEDCAYILLNASVQSGYMHMVKKLIEVALSQSQTNVFKFLKQAAIWTTSYHPKMFNYIVHRAMKHMKANKTCIRMLNELKVHPETREISLYFCNYACKNYHSEILNVILQKLSIVRPLNICVQRCLLPHLFCV